MKCSVRLDRFLLCPMSRIKAWYGIIDLYQEEDMKMRTKKWSTLLAAVIAMTGLSSITLAADYTTGLTGAYRADHKLVKGDGSSVKKSGNSTIYDFGGRDQSFSVKNSDAISFSASGMSFIVNNIGANESKGTITLRSQNTIPNGLGNASGLISDPVTLRSIAIWLLKPVRTI